MGNKGSRESLAMTVGDLIFWFVEHWIFKLTDDWFWKGFYAEFIPAKKKKKEITTDKPKERIDPKDQLTG